MTCPICGDKTHVIDSASDTEQIYRRRECVSCKHRFYTVESECINREAEYKLKTLRRLKENEVHTL